jgi:ribonucleoside-diphosphate reductase alpha chain
MGERELLSSTKAHAGLKFERYFTRPGPESRSVGTGSPYEEVDWELRTATITNEKSEVIFEQRNVEVPKDWSQTATNIVASKYFHGKRGTHERESSVRQLVGRVTDTLTRWGEEGGYFASAEDRDTFRDELTHLLLQQKVAFNSPVWFNVGVQAKPQCSACFINSIDDSMESIMNLTKTEGMLFKWGSGTGTNFSTLRGSMETLSGGGIASGPVSFMRGFDAFAGVIKSGGKTRRAAKMVILNIDHPDIEEFIGSKAKEERKAWALVGLGYEASLDGEAYSSIFFQNANHSVRVTDEFMQAVVEDRAWWTKSVTSGQPVREFRARDLLRQIAEAAHQCGDPGMQYDTTTNRWHTCKASGRINASNPCSEYVFLDDTACNLASLNLMKFLDGAGNFDGPAFRHAVDVVITAMEIIVDGASYPTEKITRNSHDYRPLGLGYANLGALLMVSGAPYDSDAGRDLGATITALMTGQAYQTSARIAEVTGPFPGYPANRESMLGVIGMHRDALRRINSQNVPAQLLEAAQDSWDQALAEGKKHGYRNAQASVLAPTGTIAFMMDCDTTGVEPDLALVKYKRLVGGGVIKIVNNTVPMALQRLGYGEEEISAIVDHIDRTGTIEGAPQLKEEHLPVFDCSLKPASGTRSIHFSGHLKMMAAVQPFISGAISKTVNMPEETTVEEIRDTYIEAWRLGLKAVAIYRDGSKKVQPLSTTARAPKAEKEPETAAARSATTVLATLQRRKLPETRNAETHKFSIAGHEGYITVGFYDKDNRQPGEIFITMAKEGSTLSGIMDSFACAISIALQYGVPLKIFVDKFSHVRFEPSGWTNNPEIPVAKSIIDYIFRWLGARYISHEYKTVDIGVTNGEGTVEPAEPSLAVKAAAEIAGVELQGARVPAPVQAPPDAPTCPDCGSLMTRNGSCYKCHNCGGTSGCS